jgi:hypothetical protein
LADGAANTAGVQKNRKKLDAKCPDDIGSGCTIVLLVKKIKKFISLSRLYLSIFAKEKITHFRMKHASSCKVWRDYFFFVVSEF